MAKVVDCPCGEKITGDTDDELVKLVQAHGKEVHQREVSREDALAMAQPAEKRSSQRPPRWLSGGRHTQGFSGH